MNEHLAKATAIMRNARRRGVVDDPSNDAKLDQLEAELRTVLADLGVDLHSQEQVEAGLAVLQAVVSGHVHPQRSPNSFEDVAAELMKVIGRIAGVASVLLNAWDHNERG